MTDDDYRPGQRRDRKPPHMKPTDDQDPRPSDTDSSSICECGEVKDPEDAKCSACADPRPSGISDTCQKGQHGWCMNRSIAECRCACECHKKPRPSDLPASAEELAKKDRAYLEERVLDLTHQMATLQRLKEHSEADRLVERHAQEAKKLNILIGDQMAQIQHLEGRLARAVDDMKRIAGMHGNMTAEQAFMLCVDIAKTFLSDSPTSTQQGQETE